MYLEHFGLREPPFAAAPDARFAHLDGHLAGVLERMEREVRVGSGGVLLLEGEHGSGKTLAAQMLLARLPDPGVRVARVRHPGVSADELLETVCDALRVPLEPGLRGSGKDMVDALGAFLMDVYAQGLRVLLVVDEAQELSDEALEQLRQLTNLQTPAHKLIHVLLLADPRLQQRLQGPSLQALSQRIAVREQLLPLDAAGVEAYLRHRLEVAGGKAPLFTRLGARSLYRYSRGVPRLVNAIAERALQRAAAESARSVGERLVQQAAREVLPGYLRYWMRRYRWWWRGFAVLLVLASAVALWTLWPRMESPATPASTPAADALADAQVRELVAALPAPDRAKMMAWSEMLARWQVGSDDISVAEAARCNAVIFPGFDCVAGIGTLTQLKRFDRPLVLDLELPQGSRPVLLLGISDESVRLALGTRNMTVSREAFARLWHGRFYAPFRLPPWMPSRIRRGDTGRAVAWVDSQLRRVDGNTEEAYGPAVYDADMEARVRKLQAAYGIPVDGVIGPETLFALTSLDDDGPHLARDVP